MGSARRGLAVWVASLFLVAVFHACSTVTPPSPIGTGESTSDATASVSVTPPAPNDTGPTPPLNVLEAKVVGTLGYLGILGQRAEYSFRGAVIWAQFDIGDALFVSAHPAGTDNSEFSVLSERQIAGLTVQRVEDTPGLIRDRFSCDDVTYAVDGTVPPGFADMEGFLAALIEALDCA